MLERLVGSFGCSSRILDRILEDPLLAPCPRKDRTESDALKEIGSFVYDVTLGGGKRQGIVCDRSAEFWTAFMLWMKL